MVITELQIGAGHAAHAEKLRTVTLTANSIDAGDAGILSSFYGNKLTHTSADSVTDKEY